MMIVDLENILNDLPEIDANRQYWFIRTQGGAYYDVFLKNNVVSIGLDRITLDMVNSVINEPNRHNLMISIVKKQYPDNQRPGLAASQLIRFFSEIKRGDVVVIPSHSTSDLAFGVVDSDEAINVSFLVADQTKRLSYNKGKSVRWEKIVPKTKVNPKLYSLFF